MRDFWTRSVVVALAVIGATGPARAELTVRGCIEYGDVDDTLEPGFCENDPAIECTSDADCGAADVCTGEYRSIYDRGLATNQPIPHVQVELRGSLTLSFAGGAETDRYGCFEIHDVPGTPNTLRVRAENEYVTVKPSKLIPLPTDTAITLDLHVPNDAYDDGDGDGVPGPYPLGYPIVATGKDAFEWSGSDSALLSAGSFVSSADIGAFVETRVESLTGGTIAVTDVPDAGTGLWLLLRPDCTDGTYTIPGDDPVTAARDTSLP